MIWQEICVLELFVVCFKLCDLCAIFGEGPLATLELCKSLEISLSFSRHPDRINTTK